MKSEKAQEKLTLQCVSRTVIGAGGVVKVRQEILITLGLSRGLFQRGKVMRAAT